MTFQKGYHPSDIIRKKMSLVMIGNKNGFKKNYIPWNKGKSICCVNHSFFKTWTPNMAYILGFIATDGCLSPNNGIKITSVNEEILIKISQEMQSTYKIGAHSAGAKQIQIYSEEIYNDLIAIGITPQKTYNLKFPDIPSEYLSHFIRGVFDGDGCVVKVTQKQPTQKNFITVWASIASASEGFVLSLKSKLNLLGLVGGHIYIKNPSAHNKQKVACYELCFRKYDSLKFYNLIYSDASMFLQRKKDKFDNIIKEVF